MHVGWIRPPPARCQCSTHRPPAQCHRSTCTAPIGSVMCGRCRVVFGQGDAPAKHNRMRTAGSVFEAMLGVTSCVRRVVYELVPCTPSSTTRHEFSGTIVPAQPLDIARVIALPATSPVGVSCGAAQHLGKYECKQKRQNKHCTSSSAAVGRPGDGAVGLPGGRVGGQTGARPHGRSFLGRIRERFGAACVAATPPGPNYRKSMFWSPGYLVRRTLRHRRVGQAQGCSRLGRRRCTSMPQG